MVEVRVRVIRVRGSCPVQQQPLMSDEVLRVKGFMSGIITTFMFDYGLRVRGYCSV
jgi:hypothetical protein